MRSREAFTAVLLLAAVLVSSGCVASDIEEDSLPGQVLEVFGNFSSDGNTTSYEFSVDSLTDNAVMAPMQDTVDQFKKNISQREGVEMKSTTVELVNISSDSVKVRMDYRIESNETGTLDRSITFTMVRRDGQWVLKDPIKQDMGREDPNIYPRPP